MALSPRSTSSSSIPIIATASPTCTQKRAHTGSKPATAANVTGVVAQIKTRYGDLCQEGTGTAVAFSSAWAGVIYSTPTVLWWCQAGFRRRRLSGSTTIEVLFYAEMQGSGALQQFFLPNVTPVNDSLHTYQCELDKSTGIWTTYLDSNVLKVFPANTGWKNQGGNGVQYTGEILNKEDDMPGTSSDKCNFTGCSFHYAGQAFQSAGIASGNLIKEDPRSTAEVVNSSALNIWLI
jgi:hypothetical protein